jgi:hypothetical protein
MQKLLIFVVSPRLVCALKNEVINLHATLTPEIKQPEREVHH